MGDDAFDSDHEQCSYCGKWIYADSPRCPSCGNYTDGLGDFAKPEARSGQRLAPLWVIAGWLALIGIVAPFLIALYYHFKR